MNIDIQSVLPPSPPEGQGMSDYFNPHVEPLQISVPISPLESLHSIPVGMKAALTEERRKRAVEGAITVNTIVSQKESLDRAHIDPVTGSRNAVAFAQEWPLIAERKKAGEVTIVYIDLNGLNRVNNNYDHAVGDKYLQDSAQSIESGLRPTDIVYRVGGDELVAVLDGKIDKKSQKVVKDRLKDRGRVVAEGLGLPEDLDLGFSVGIASKRKLDTPDTLKNRADLDCKGDKDATYDEILARTGRDYKRKGK